MTVATETSEASYIANGVLTAFAVPFGWHANSQVVVKKKLSGSDTWVTQVEGVDYTLAGVGTPPASGTVTFTVAPANLATVWVYREVDFTQPSALRAAGAFSAATHENNFDNAVFQTQQLDRRVAVLEAGSAALDAYSAIRVTTTFTTHASAVESSFPKNVAMPAGTVALGARVVKVLKTADPAAIFYETVDCPGWTQTGDNLVLNYVTGLDPNTEYTLTIEVLK